MVRAKAITSMNLQNKHKLSLVKVVSSIWVIDITLYHSHQDSHFGSWSPHPCEHYKPMEKGFYYLSIKDHFAFIYIFCIAKIPRPFDVSKVPFMMSFEALETTYKKMCTDGCGVSMRKHFCEYLFSKRRQAWSHCTLFIEAEWILRAG